MTDIMSHIKRPERNIFKILSTKNVGNLFKSTYKK